MPPSANNEVRYYLSMITHFKCADTEALMQGQYSIRINDQWRVCFVWADGHVTQVEIVDYH